MKPFQAKWNKETGGLNFGERKEELIAFAKKNPKMRYELIPTMPESYKKRKFYFGAFLRLWAYLDGRDWKSWEVIQDYHEIAKMEFLPEVRIANGKTYKLAGSSVGKLDDLLEKGIDMLVEQYGIDPMKVLNPKHFKDFRDRVYASSEYETYIDYLIDIKLLQ